MDTHTALRPTPIPPRAAVRKYLRATIRNGHRNYENLFFLAACRATLELCPARLVHARLRHRSSSKSCLAIRGRSRPTAEARSFDLDRHRRLASPGAGYASRGGRVRGMVRRCLRRAVRAVPMM